MQAMEDNCTALYSEVMLGDKVLPVERNIILISWAR